MEIGKEYLVHPTIKLDKVIVFTSTLWAYCAFQAYKDQSIHSEILMNCSWMVHFLN